MSKTQSMYGSHVCHGSCDGKNPRRDTEGSLGALVWREEISSLKERGRDAWVGFRVNYELCYPYQRPMDLACF